MNHLTYLNSILSLKLPNALRVIKKKNCISELKFNGETDTYIFQDESL